MTAPSAIRRLNAADADFARHLDHLLSWESVSDDGVNERVLEIIKAVRERGDAALVELTQRFDPGFAPRRPAVPAPSRRDDDAR